MLHRFAWIILIVITLTSNVLAYETHITVAQDNTGDFTTIQQAINATKTFPWHDITIRIKNGIYHEKVNIYAWNPRIRLIGESREKTIIRFDDYFDKINLGRNSTFHTYTMRVAGNDFIAANLTIENTAGPVGQAVALHVEADRAAFYNVSVKGYQDTLYVAGEGHRTYFNQCYIEGSVDFIFGGGTAYFEQCEIRSLLPDTYVTAASTPASQQYGLVFNRCQFTAPQQVSGVYLGRPWRQYAKTLIINSELGQHIHPQGWHNWDNADNEKSVTYVEGNNRGAGAKSTHRVAWAQSLPITQSGTVEAEHVLRGWQPSMPTPLQ